MLLQEVVEKPKTRKLITEVVDDRDCKDVILEAKGKKKKL
jgi:hypothetical protein